ncbi:MAG: hypothetical protein ACREEI_11905, partial [Stellaceae bacterium]
DMVRINGVAKAEAVGEESGAEQEGITVEGNNGYEPENDVCDAEEGVDANHLVAHASMVIAEDPTDWPPHRRLVPVQSILTGRL